MSAPNELYLGFPKGENANRLRQAHKTDRIIGLSGFGKNLTTESERKDFIDGLTSPQFIDYLTTLNGLVLNLPRNERTLATSVQFTGDSSQGLFTDIMPAPEDKEFLLGEVLKIAQGVDKIQMKALILGYGINAVHPFEDGNGRVARSVYYLISRGYEEGSGNILSAMDPIGVRSHQLDGMLISQGAYQLLQEKMGTHDSVIKNDILETFPRVIPQVKNFDLHPCQVVPINREWNKDQMADMAAIFNNKDLSPMVSYLLANTYNSNAVSLAKGKIDGLSVFYLDEFFRNATDKEIGYAYDAYRNIKRQHVLTMLNTLAMNENTHVRAVAQLKSGVMHTATWAEIAFLATEGFTKAPDNQG